jgi:hypothetical protein
MPRNRNIIVLAAGSLVLGVISTSAVSQTKNSNTAPIQLAYFQAVKNPMNATCPNPRHRKVKTSQGYRWRWVC